MMLTNKHNKRSILGQVYEHTQADNKLINMPQLEAKVNYEPSEVKTYKMCIALRHKNLVDVLRKSGDNLLLKSHKNSAFCQHLCDR